MEDQSSHTGAPNKLPWLAPAVIWSRFSGTCSAGQGRRCCTRGCISCRCNSRRADPAAASCMADRHTAVLLFAAAPCFFRAPWKPLKARARRMAELCTPGERLALAVSAAPYVHYNGQERPMACSRSARVPTAAAAARFCRCRHATRSRQRFEMFRPSTTLAVAPACGTPSSVPH